MAGRMVKCLRCGEKNAVTSVQRREGKASRHCPKCRRIHRVLFPARRALIRLGSEALSAGNLGLWRHCENAGIELEELEAELNMLEREAEIELTDK